MKFLSASLKFILCAAIALCLPLASTAGDLPAEKAGTIAKPTGTIAFVRDKAVWVMNADGSGQSKLTGGSSNPDGQLSWAPDGRRVAYTASGVMEYKAPDMMGGRHKIYDLFIAFLDSMEAGNSAFWHRLTNGLGSRDPQWTADGKELIFYKDLNANQIDAILPNYQICVMQSNGDYPKVLRKDWQLFDSTFFISPSMNAKGDIAFVVNDRKSPLGFAVMNRDNFMLPVDSVIKLARKNYKLVAPTWSPDGKWIACLSNKMEDAGMYLVSADLSEKYLVAQPPPGTYFMSMAPSFSPDSKWLTYSTNDGSVWIIDIMGNNARRLTPPGLDRAPAWSK